MLLGEEVVLLGGVNGGVAREEPAPVRGPGNMPPGAVLAPVVEVVVPLGEVVVPLGEVSVPPGEAFEPLEDEIVPGWEGVWPPGKVRVPAEEVAEPLGDGEAVPVAGVVAGGDGVKPAALPRGGVVGVEVTVGDVGASLGGGVLVPLGEGGVAA